MLGLRFVMRDGKKILQMCQPHISGFDEDGVAHFSGQPTDWEDVPLEVETYLADEISLCPGCHCMTHGEATCGKCGAGKVKP